MAIYKSDQPTKDGRQYYFMVYKKDFNGINKKYKSKKYKTKTEAKEEEALFLLRRDNPINKPFKLVANAYFDELYSIRKESTVDSYINAYEKNIRPYFNKFNINDINIHTINNWKLEMAKKGFKINYLNKLYNVFKNIFDFAMKNYDLTTNPVAISGRFQSKNDEITKDDEKLRYITYEQFQILVSVMDDTLWKTFFTFLYYTGMRKGEVLALKWNDIDFANNEIIVNKTLYTKIKGKIITTSTKNNLNRKIKMSKTLREQLIIYKNQIMKYTDYNDNWYVFGCGTYMPLSTIDRYKNYYFKQANLSPITIHEFRHSHVSLLINEYIKSGQTDTTKFFLMMSNRMGHSVQVMQRTYLHLFPTIQNEIVDILNNL